jgi:hypothetical protein
MNLLEMCKVLYIYFERVLLKVKRAKVLATDKLFETNLRLLEHAMNKRGSSLQVGMKRITTTNEARTFEKSKKNDFSDWGIVFQGQLQNAQSASYLKDTIKTIRRVFPELPIVLSSYFGKCENELKLICIENNCELVLTIDPGKVNPPFSPNIIRQITSSHNGLKFLETIGITKAIKIRFDQRILRPESLVFVEKIFQIIQNSNSFIEKPILTTSLNSYDSLPGFASDMMHFGYIQSMLKYWKLIDKVDFEDVTDEIFQATDPEVKLLSSHPEVWLALRYLRNFHEGFLAPSEFNEKIWCSLIGLIDCETIGQEWSKTLPIFVSNYQSVKWLTVNQPERYEELRFHKWLSMLS